MQKVYHSLRPLLSISQWRVQEWWGKSWGHHYEDLSWPIRSSGAKMALETRNWAFLFYIDQSLDASSLGREHNMEREGSVSWYSGSWGNECFRTEVARWAKAYLNAYQNRLRAILKSICLIPVLGTTPLGFWWTSFPGENFQEEG